jgi:peptide/nickel transport system ATP-binding protein/oligopeptide transport system ATP-binding protein
LSLLEIRRLAVHYPVRGGVLQRTVGRVRAVDGVDLAVRQGEIMGIVGESGCGKSTLSRALVGLARPCAGEIRFDGRDILRLAGAEARRVRRDIQIIFQDPVASLNPRLRIRDIVLEGRRIQGLADRGTDEAVLDDILLKVGLGTELASRYPHELSGGQRQRVGIARTLVLNPRLVVADEPVSALDVSIQSQVLNLLVDLRRELGLTYIFIAHNLAVVGYIADRIAVMYLGRIVELLDAATIHLTARHPYTVALLSAVPDVSARRPRPGRVRLAGDLPSPLNPPSGCRFRTRCPVARPLCAQQEPALTARGGAHPVACHFPGALELMAAAMPEATIGASQ